MTKDRKSEKRATDLERFAARMAQVAPLVEALTVEEKAKFRAILEAMQDD